MADEGSQFQLTVFRGDPPSGTYVWSPFVTKLEARLRFDGVPYGLGGGSPRTAPKGKVPYIELKGPDGETDSLGDSTLIVKSLVANGILSDANSYLSPSERAHDLAIRALMEDKAYFYASREKWLDNYEEMRNGVLSSLSWPLQPIVGWLAHRNVTSTLYGQGTGRLTDQEVLAFKEEIWASVNALLTESVKRSSRKNSIPNAGDRDDDGDEDPFWVLGSTEPTEADSTLYGFIAGSLLCTA